MIVVGIFELTPVSPGRWRVLNTQTQVGHVTYGTEEEVVEVLKKATIAWQRRTAPQKQGNAWRDRITFEATTKVKPD